MAKQRKPKTRTRYSIGEWYGKGFETINFADRFQLAKTEQELDALTGLPCPFQIEGAICNKKGGVCSLRAYEQTGDGPVLGKGPIITTCPLRFLQSETIFKWVGEKLLGTSEPLVLGEIGFLDRLRPQDQVQDEDTDNRDFIGRIDNVLVHPNKEPLDWCALELQAVYFSGKSMRNEFK